ncbi:MAG: hypothetical protein ACI35S_04490 [Anaeroplasma sp.]
MLVTGTNVLAGGNDKEDSKSPSSSKRLPIINIAVVGDDDKGKENFIKSYTEIKGENYHGVQSYKLKYKEQIIKFFDIPSDLGRDSDNEFEEKWINNFLRSSKRNRGVPFCAYVIICLNVETEKDKLVKRAYDWLEEIKSRNKDYQMKLVLYIITKENCLNYNDKISGVLSTLSDFECEFMKKNPSVSQFRSFSAFPHSKRFILNDAISKSNRRIENVNSDIFSLSESLVPLFSIILALWDISLVVGIIVVCIFYNSN